jgi:hypothetical protein
MCVPLTTTSSQVLPARTPEPIPAPVFIRQAHRPGTEADVDLGEVAVRLRGTLVTINSAAGQRSATGERLRSVPTVTTTY